MAPNFGEIIHDGNDKDFYPIARELDLKSLKGQGSLCPCRTPHL